MAALPPGMPLAAAAAVLSPMLRDRLHRRRSACLVKNLHRARLAAVGGVLCDVQAARVVVDEERACPHCHLRLGGKVFVLLTPGASPAPGSSSAPAESAAGGPAAEPGPPQRLRSPGEDSLAVAEARLQQQVQEWHTPQVLCFTCYKRYFTPESASRTAAALGLPPAAPVS